MVEVARALKEREPRAEPEAKTDDCGAPPTPAREVLGSVHRASVRAQEDARDQEGPATGLEVDAASGSAGPSERAVRSRGRTSRDLVPPQLSRWEWRMSGTSTGAQL